MDLFRSFFISIKLILLQYQVNPYSNHVNRRGNRMRNTSRAYIPIFVYISILSIVLIGCDPENKIMSGDEVPLKDGNESSFPDNSFEYTGEKEISFGLLFSDTDRDGIGFHSNDPDSITEDDLRLTGGEFDISGIFDVDGLGSFDATATNLPPVEQTIADVWPRHYSYTSSEFTQSADGTQSTWAISELDSQFYEDLDNVFQTGRYELVDAIIAEGGGGGDGDDGCDTCIIQPSASDSDIVSEFESQGFTVTNVTEQEVTVKSQGEELMGVEMTSVIVFDRQTGEIKQSKLQLPHGEETIFEPGVDRYGNPTLGSSRVTLQLEGN